MCGGFIVAYSSAKIEPNSSSLTQLFSHFLYNLGRVFSYVLIGASLGYFGQNISYSEVAAGYVYFFVGIFMVLMGFSLMGKLKFLTSIESSLALHPKVKEIFSNLIKSKKKSSFFYLGMLNGFLPCGVVYFFAVSAIASASWYKGAIIMVIFGISTIPVLFGLGFFVGFLKSINFRELMVKISSIIVILYGIYLAYIGFLATQGIESI